jgi:hypothetical protein
MGKLHLKFWKNTEGESLSHQMRKGLVKSCKVTGTYQVTKGGVGGGGAAETVKSQGSSKHVRKRRPRAGVQGWGWRDPGESRGTGSSGEVWGKEERWKGRRGWRSWRTGAAESPRHFAALQDPQHRPGPAPTRGRTRDPTPKTLGPAAGGDPGAGRPLTAPHRSRWGRGRGAPGTATPVPGVLTPREAVGSRRPGGHRSGATSCVGRPHPSAPKIAISQQAQRPQPPRRRPPQPRPAAATRNPHAALAGTRPSPHPHPGHAPPPADPTPPFLRARRVPATPAPRTTRARAPPSPRTPVRPGTAPCAAATPSLPTPDPESGFLWACAERGHRGHLWKNPLLRVFRTIQRRWRASQ